MRNDTAQITVIEMVKVAPIYWVHLCAVSYDSIELQLGCWVRVALVDRFDVGDDILT